MFSQHDVRRHAPQRHHQGDGKGQEDNCELENWGAGHPKRDVGENIVARGAEIRGAGSAGVLQHVSDRLQEGIAGPEQEGGKDNGICAQNLF